MVVEGGDCGGGYRVTVVMMVALEGKLVGSLILVVGGGVACIAGIGW